MVCPATDPRMAPMKPNLPLVAWLLLAPWLLAGESCPAHAVRCTDVVILDGDSVRADISLGFGVVLPDRVIRAAGMDAWESSRHRRTVVVTDDELSRGRLATAALAGLVQSGSLYAVDSGRRDPYGRLSAYLWVYRGGEWIEVKAFMASGGHLRVTQ